MKALVAIVLVACAAYGIAGTVSAKESKQVVEKATLSRLAKAEAAAGI